MCDALHEISDISDSAIADFFIDLASKSTNSDDLVRRRDTETLDIDDKVVRFAKALFDKVPRTSTSSVGEKRRQENRAKEREAVMSQSKRYLLIDSDNDDEMLKIVPKKVKKSKKEKRKKTSDNDDDDEFDKVLLSNFRLA